MKYVITSTDWGIDRLTVTDEQGGQYSAMLSPLVLETVKQQVSLMHLWIERAQAEFDFGLATADNGQVSNDHTSSEV